MLVSQIRILLWFCLSTLLWMENARANELCAEEQYVLSEFDNGAAWEMCWTSRERENIVLSNVRYRPVNGEFTSVFSSLSLSQLHVAYDDNNITYNDVTQFGLGTFHIGRLNEADCPKGELLDINGNPGICKVQSMGDEAYRTANGAQYAESVSLFSVSHVGSYAYLITWQFFSDGSVQPSIGAAGALQRASEHVHSAHGRELEGSPEKSWLSHTHNYYWRMDFDLGDNNNDDKLSELNLIPDALGRRARQTQTFSIEAARKIAPQQMRSWLVTSGNKPVEEAPGYSIEPSYYGHKLERPDIEPFTKYDLFVTKHKDCERYSSENNKFYPECGSDLLSFVNEESVENADIVVWHRISFHHVPRNEDQANMHSHWDGFFMRARNLSAATPGHNGSQGDIILADSAVNDLASTSLAPENNPELRNPPAIVVGRQGSANLSWPLLLIFSILLALRTVRFE